MTNVTYSIALRIFNNLCEVIDGSFSVRILEKHRTDIAIGEVDIKYIANEDLKAKGKGAGSNHGERLRVKLV